MRKFAITCASTCDLNEEFLIKNNVNFVSFFYYINNEKYIDNFFQDQNVNDFYQSIKNNDVKTSQPDPEQYKNLWLKLIDEGFDILHIELSSGISGAVNSALIAKNMVNDINKDANIYVIDSLCASAGYGLLVKKAIKYRDNNKSLEETYEYIENLKHNVNHIVFITDLNNLIKGGRLKPLAGNIAKVLNIIPILNVTNDGKLEVIKKTRGVNAAIDELLSLMNSNIIDGVNYSDEILLSTSNRYDVGVNIIDKLKPIYKNAKLSNDNIYNIGTVIGSHTGEGTVAMFYIGNGRINI